jgi:hypothetical protein
VSRLAILLLGAAFAGPTLAQEKCAVSQDLVVRALELASATPSRTDLARGVSLLKQAEEACDENGDAWYYRGIFERKLGQGNPDYSLGKARDRKSRALAAADDPFSLATPSRGVGALAHSESPAGAKARLDIRKPEVAHKWALVVGIGNFKNPRLNLKYTRNDSDSMAGLLKDPNYGRFDPAHVRLINDAEATTVNIRAGLNWLAREAGEDDLAVIYMATHGSAREQDVAGANYVVAYDSDVESRDGLYSTAIPMVEISNVVRTRLRALKVVVILDTCHSQGALAQTVTVPSSLSQQTLDHIREGTGRIILAASQTEESSYESPKYGHGLFTYYLLEGLKTQKDTPIDQIFESVKQRVTQDASASGWKQHPVFSASDSQSTVVIGVPPLSPAPAGVR